LACFTKTDKKNYFTFFFLKTHKVETHAEKRELSNFVDFRYNRDDKNDDETKKGRKTRKK